MDRKQERAYIKLSDEWEDWGVERLETGEPDMTLEEWATVHRPKLLYLLDL